MCPWSLRTEGRDCLDLPRIDVSLSAISGLLWEIETVTISFSPLRSAKLHGSSSRDLWRSWKRLSEILETLQEVISDSESIYKRTLVSRDTPEGETSREDTPIGWILLFRVISLKLSHQFLTRTNKDRSEISLSFRENFTTRVSTRKKRGTTILFPSTFPRPTNRNALPNA